MVRKITEQRPFSGRGRLTVNEINIRTAHKTNLCEASIYPIFYSPCCQKIHRTNIYDSFLSIKAYPVLRIHLTKYFIFEVTVGPWNIFISSGTSCSYLVTNFSKKDLEILSLMRPLETKILII